MSIIVSESNLVPVSDIITDALQLVGVIGAGQTASDDDFNVCLSALNNIFAELPLHGLSWPKITAEPVALTWSASAPAQVGLPADYCGAPSVSYALNGASVPVQVIAKAQYDALTQPAAAGTPTLLYIAPNNVGYLWPVPASDPGLLMTYQAVSMGGAVSDTPDVARTWIAGLGLWLANEVAVKFGVDMASRQDIERRFLGRRKIMLAYAAESAPIRFTVAD